MCDFLITIVAAHHTHLNTHTHTHTQTLTGKVYQKIMEIESRLLPCGLHTVGVPPTAEEVRD